MMISVSCSWCRTLNPMTVRFCRQCGHCAHKARMLCDCPKCILIYGAPQVAQPKEKKPDETKDEA